MFDSTIGPESQEGTIRVDRGTDGITAVCLEGDLDLTNAPVLDDEIDRALESGTGLILDLSDATFIDSSVIHVLLGAARKASGPEEPAVVLQLGTAASVERVLKIVSMEASAAPRAQPAGGHPHHSGQPHTWATRRRVSRSGGIAVTSQARASIAGNCVAAERD